MTVLNRKKKMLREARMTAYRLARQVEDLNLFLAGTPEEILAQLEALADLPPLEVQS